MVAGLPRVLALPQAGPRTLWRLPLWAGLLILTSLILAYPVDLRLEPYVVWSPDIFPNLPLFGVLFYLWSALLVLLLFTASGEVAARWERLALVALTALVYRGFWNVIAPIQGQALIHAGDAKVWLGLGNVVSYPNTGYFDWPGATLILSMLAQVTGLELFSSIAIIAVFTAVVIGIATYVFLLHALNSSLYAALASLLIIAGNLALTIFYTAGPVAIPFVILFLALLFQKGGLDSPSRMSAALVLLVGAALTHLHTSMHFFFFLLGLWGLALLGVRQPGLQPRIATLSLFFIVPVAWIVYWGLKGFAWITRGGAAFLGDPLNVWERLTGVFTIGEANFGESAPGWYSWTRLTWLALLYGAGGLVWLWHLRILPRLDATATKLAGAFSGLILLSLLSSAASPRGFGELLRGLTYVPFFTVPFLLLALRQLKPQVARAALLGLAAVLFALSLPTFLADHRTINQNSQHQIEFAAAAWFQSLYDTGQGIYFYGGQGDLVPMWFYLPDARFDSPRETESTGYTKQSRWRGLEELLDKFERTSQIGLPAFYLQSPKTIVDSRMIFGIPVDDPRWGQMHGALSNKHAKVYDNGPLAIYSGKP